MNRRAALLAVLCWLIPSLSLAGSLPQNYTVKEHAYIWRADGSSSTQGSGSISGWPTKTSGTASCTLSQVTESPNGVMPPGSGTLIKAACTAGASPGSISFTARTTGFTLSQVSTFGYYLYTDSDDASLYSGPNMLLSTSVGNYYAYACLHTSAMNRRVKGWNLCEYRSGDHYNNVGSMTDSLTILDVVFQFTPVANQSFTLYFSDTIKNFYAKPQVTIWFADNLVEGYSNGFPYMQARNMTGCYMPTTDYLAAPNGSQLTVANLLEMQTAGWDIVPHQTIGTTLTSMTEAEMRAEIEEVFAAHRQYGFTYFDMYYPAGGGHNATVDAVLQSYGVKYGNNSNASALPRPLYGGLINPMHWWAYNSDAKSFATVRGVIDNAIKYGGYVGLLWHAPADADLTVYQQTVDYLYRLREANVLDVPNCKAFYNRLTYPRRTR